MKFNPILQELHRSFAELIMAFQWEFLLLLGQGQKEHMEILAAGKFFPGLLLSPVKEILHTNASIKLEENLVQSYF